ncbi:MAG: DUF2802 domain-containing protein [Gammaproteobacteria bacterium]
MNALLATHLPLLALAATLLVTSGAGAIAMARLARRQRALAATVTAQAARIDGLERDLGAILSCSRRIGERLGDSERARAGLQKQLDRLRHHAEGGDEHLAVEHAMKLLEGGLPLEEVVRVCELSEGEAEILQSLARFRAAA